MAQVKSTCCFPNDANWIKSSINDIHMIESNCMSLNCIRWWWSNLGDAVTVELQRECIDDMYLANFINSVSLIYVKCTPVIASMVKPILHACVVWHQMLGVREEDIKWSTVREVVTCYEAHGVPLPPDVSEACTTLFLYFILSHVIIEHLCTGSLYNSII